MMILYYIIGANAILGFLIMTWALIKTRPLSQGEFHADFPAYRRTDTSSWCFIFLF